MKLKSVLFAILILSAFLFASCTKNESDEEWEPPKKTEQTQNASSEEAEPEKRDGIKAMDFILMGYGNSGQPQNKRLIETMLETLNGRLAEGIGAEVRLNWAPYSTYQESVMEMLASKDGIDAVDPMYSGSTVFTELLNSGMLMDIRDGFRLYMPETYSLLYEKYAYLDDYLLTDGAQYVIPSINAYPMRSYIITLRELYGEYGKEIATLEDYEDYMQWISENKPGMTAGYANPIEAIDIYLKGHGYTMHGATSFYSPLEDYGKVIPMERIPEFRGIYEMLAGWNKKGYQGDVSSGGQFIAAQSGKLASMLAAPSYSKISDNTITLPTSMEFEYIVLYKQTKAICVPSFTGPCVLKDADAVAEVLMFYELIYTEQDYYDVIQYGIEDENYRKIGEKLILPEQTSKSIRGWYGSGNFYNYLMERPLWSEPDDFVQFFEDISFYNTVTSAQLSNEQGTDSGASKIDEETMEEINMLYEEGINPLLDERFGVYERFADKLARGDYSMTADEAIEMLEEGNAQEIIDIYAEIQKLYDGSAE